MKLCYWKERRIGSIRPQPSTNRRNRSIRFSQADCKTISSNRLPGLVGHLNCSQTNTSCPFLVIKLFVIESLVKPNTNTDIIIDLPVANNVWYLPQAIRRTFSCFIAFKKSYFITFQVINRNYKSLFLHLTQLGLSTLFSCPSPSWPQLLDPNIKTRPFSVCFLINFYFIISYNQSNTLIL